MGAGDRDTLQRETQKRKRGRRFIQGLSGFRNSWRLRLCTKVILHKSLLALQSFVRERDKGSPTMMSLPDLENIGLSFEKKHFFFFF